MGALGEECLNGKLLPRPWQAEEVRDAANRVYRVAAKSGNAGEYIVNVVLSCITVHGKIVSSMFLHFVATLCIRADCDRRCIGN